MKTAEDAKDAEMSFRFLFLMINPYKLLGNQVT